MDALKLMAESCMKKDLPVVNVGDTVRVGVKIKEGERENSGLRGHCNCQEARRNRRDLHRSQSCSRRWYREEYSPFIPLLLPAWK